MTINKEGLSGKKQTEQISLHYYAGNETKDKGIPVYVNGVMDEDGNYYGVVRIADQIWMAENLNTGTRINATGLPSNDDRIEKYCYDNLESNCSTYGGLYTWKEMMDYVLFEKGVPMEFSHTEGSEGILTNFNSVQGISPEGWHIPTWVEVMHMWDNLEGISNSGGMLKDTSSLWQQSNVLATNETGFSAIPGGYLIWNGDALVFTWLSEYAIFPSGSAFQGESGSVFYPQWRLMNFTKVIYATYDYTSGYEAGSVRCVKDP